MTREIGWVEEVTEGTETVEVATAVTNFGEMHYDRPHPWQSYQIAPQFQEDYKLPVDLIAGMVNVKFKLKYNYVHGWPWYYAGGTKVHSTATKDYIYFSTGAAVGGLAASPIKSRSVYSRVDSDIIVAKGCKTKNFSFHCEASEPGGKPSAIWCEEDLWGWGTATHAAVTADPAVVAPTGLTNTGAKGFTEVALKTYNGNALANLREFNIVISNTLDIHGALGSATPRGIKQLEGSTVLVHFLATLDGTSNDLLSVQRATDPTDATPFAKGATNNLVITINFNTGGTEYHKFTLHNLRIYDSQPIVYKDKITAYSCVGQLLQDGSSVPFTVELVDGVDYQTA